ncbi:MAG: hypothetical protein V9F00_14575 [Nocardioides sp.]
MRAATAATWTPTRRAGPWRSASPSSSLDLVADQQLSLLRRHLRCSDAELETAIALVRSCHPRPGSTVSSQQAEYVIPDVFVRRTDHGWVVEINQATVPRVRVNQNYANLVSRSADHAMLRTQLQEARWLLRSLEIRNETLLKVARCIVQRQAAFFELGDEGMQPLILQGRRRGRRDARVDHLARHHRQVHAHAAWRVRVPATFSRATWLRAGRHRDVLHRDPRQDPQAGRAGNGRQAAVRQRTACRQGDRCDTA